jgi:hypothetical protein
LTVESWLRVFVLVAAAGVAAGASAVLLAAGAMERRGDVARARRIARPAGFAGGVAALLALAAAVAALALGRPPGDAWVVAGVASMIAGSSCLLAGLAGKPRPTAALSSLVLGLGLALAAALASGRLRFR